MITDWAFGRPGGPALKEAGVTGAIRYLCKDPRKRLDATEVADYRAHGIDIHAVYQDGVGDWRGGRTAGVNNAQRALRQARDLGWDGRGCIYYTSADENVGTSDLPILRDYGRGWASVIDPKQLGVYGEAMVLDDFFALGLVGYRWQAAAMSFSDFRIATCNLRQLARQITVNGVQMDVNVTPFNFNTGAWFKGAENVSATGPENWDAKDWAAFDNHVWKKAPEAADGGETPIRQGNMMQVLNKAYVFGGANVASLKTVQDVLNELVAAVQALEPAAAATLEGTLEVTLAPKHEV